MWSWRVGWLFLKAKVYIRFLRGLVSPPGSETRPSRGVSEPSGGEKKSHIYIRFLLFSESRPQEQKTEEKTNVELAFSLFSSLFSSGVEFLSLRRLENSPLEFLKTGEKRKLRNSPAEKTEEKSNIDLAFRLFSPAAEFLRWRNRI